ncbi:SMC-Scp complex subunit ScpB [Oceanicoccus sagamiensis]|uniref:SMC-Scp complex subunit ScpB n=1 Tax=Oceanicoccus sagamiensis TaxID=716816 RepID=A0A1X9NAF7_9GAMM|nr:SMC-Scp complex subunit ScpB [Oceanicoccus sagamiensis]ARN75028.1 SMC-Scp complex subunit ScpB [Oceanicoccus sagamiensis]
MSIDSKQLQNILEGALLASAKPLTVAQMAELFDEEMEERPANDVIRAVLEDIQHACEGRGFELKEVNSGFRFQVVQTVAPWVGRLWEEKPQKYSRALLETLALIAYRQPITRGDIEDIRGVAVSSNIIKTLLEREWVRVVGHKDVPGRPAMYATTRRFLDYFNLKNLEDLPTLAEIRDLDTMNEELALEGADTLDPEAVAAGTEDTLGEDTVSEESPAADLDNDDTANTDDATVEMEFIDELDDHANDDSNTVEAVETDAGDSESIDETKAGDESDIPA